MVATSAVEACAARGRARGLGLVGSAGALGFAAELAGVATGRPFGHYTYSGQLGPRVGGVPVAAAGAWAMMARPGVGRGGAGGGAAARRARRAGGGRADRVGRLPRPADGARGLLVVAGRRPLRGHPGVELRRLARDERRRVRGLGPARRRRRSAADGDGALALYLWTWVGETFANVAIWRRPRVALAGGAAMGAVRGAGAAGPPARPLRWPGGRRRRRRRRAGLRAAAGARRPRGDGARAGRGRGRQVRAHRARRLSLRRRAVAADDAVARARAARRRASSSCASSRSRATASPTARASSCRRTCRAASAALEAWSPGAGADWARLHAHLRGDVARLAAGALRPAAVAAAA